MCHGSLQDCACGVGNGQCGQCLPRTRHIPIVALTGHALAGHAEGAREAGCDAFVTKPCLPDALVTEIRRLLDHHRAKTDNTGDTARATKSTRKRS